MDFPQIISLILAPAVLLSVVTLLLLSIYTRLAAILSKLKTLDLEIFSFLSIPATNFIKSRSTLIKAQSLALLSRAKILQIAIYFYESSLLVLMVSGLFIALTSVSIVFIPISLVFIAIGIVDFGLGICFALKEVSVCVSTSFIEVDQIKVMDEMISGAGVVNCPQVTF